jgi:single stranded DNA-binding protein
VDNDAVIHRDAAGLLRSRCGQPGWKWPGEPNAGRLGTGGAQRLGTGGTRPPDRRRIEMSKPGYVTLVGFVATEPRMSSFNDGDVASLRIGSTLSWIDRATGEWRHGETSFYSVKCRRSLARNAKKSLRKGEPIVVAGKLRTRSYQDRNGVQRLDVEVEADTIGYDLCRGTADFRWNQRASAGLSDLARGEAIRAGLEHEDDPRPGDLALEETGALAGADDGDGMFDDHAVAGLQHDLEASAAEPAAG